MISSLAQGIDLVSGIGPQTWLVVKFMFEKLRQRVTDIAEWYQPDAKQKIIGIQSEGETYTRKWFHRGGSTYEYDGYYKILPQTFDWDKDPRGLKMVFVKVAGLMLSNSDSNTEWMKKETSFVLLEVKAR